MTFLSIVDRELRVAARRRSTYLLRIGFGSGALAIGAFFYLGRLLAPHSTLPLWQLGNNLFALLVVLSLIFCLISGIRDTADCLSQEKREGTLGLLFLTDLKGYDVVLGKLAATSLAGFYGLLAVFPVLALTMLVGGVSFAQFWRMALVLMNSVLFSLSTGMLVSVMSRNPRKAMAGTLVLLLLFVVVFPFAGGIALLLGRAHRALANLLFLPCPFDAFYWGCLHYGWGTRHLFWGSVSVTAGLSLLFLVLASLLAPGCWQDKPADAGARRWRDRWYDWVYGNGHGRTRFRQQILAINPFYWLAARVRLKPLHVWTFLIVIAGLWAWGCIGCGSEWFHEGVYFPTAILLNSALKLWLTSEAGRRLGEDRHSGALDLVLSTTLTPKEILRGQWLALARQFLFPGLFVIGLHGIFLLASLQREPFHVNPLNPVVWCAGAFMLLLDVFALGWVAMWVALTAKSPNRITGITVARLLVAPWVLYLAICAVGAAVADFHNWPKPTWKFFVGLWFGLGVAFDVAFGLTAWHQLHTRFRQLGLRHYTSVHSRFAFRAGKTP